MAILIFDGVEVLDFTGPFEVFSRTRLEPGPESRRSEESAPFEVVTVARNLEPVQATGGLLVTPHSGFDDLRQADLLLVPGGFGTRALVEDRETLSWIRSVAQTAEWVTSVCTGALLLARVGLLEGRRATTHYGAYELLEEIGEGQVEVVRGVRFVDDGVVTSAGVAAGIDMAFHLVARLCGDEVARETAAYIEYPYRPQDA